MRLLYGRIETYRDKGRGQKDDGDDGEDQKKLVDLPAFDALSDRRGIEKLINSHVSWYY